MFFASANEERQHGLKFLEYLKMRGDEVQDIGIDVLAPILGKDTYVFSWHCYCKMRELFNLVTHRSEHKYSVMVRKKLININNLCQNIIYLHTNFIDYF